MMEDRELHDALPEPLALCAPSALPPDRYDTEDRRLIEQIAQQRDAAAFEALYERFKPRLAAFLARLTRDPAIVEEIYNDVMWLVWNKAGTYHGGSRVSTWIFAIGYRRCLKALGRDRKRRSREVELVDDGDRVSDEDARHHDEHALQQGQAAVDALLEHREQRQRIEAALQKLSVEHRMVVELSYFADYGYEEIARIAGCPVNTIKTRMFYARRRLRDVLVSFDGSSPSARQQS